MVKILPDISRTFSEYLLIPNLSKKKHVVSNISLKTPIAKFKKNEEPLMSMNIPFISASMQSVSGVEMAIALARLGGLASVYCSQPIDKQVEKVKRVKQYKAGFVDSDSNVKPDTPLKEAIALIKRTGHSTVAVTHDGSQKGRFVGILTEKDFWEYEDDIDKPVSQYMTPVEKVVFGTVGISLHEASSELHKKKKDCLPVLDKQGNLDSLVFKKDFFDYQNNPNEMLDNKKRLQVAAAINTHDYKDRVPALIDAGADVLIMDASDGYSEFQKDTALWVRERYGRSVVLGGGNIISSDGFRYLVEETDIDFVKVGIGGGAICITREQKGIGRGQASALLEIISEREKYYRETGIYIPVCSDGGLANDTQIIIALAMGADFVMMGRYFAMTSESPTPKISMSGRLFKPFWGEGSNRARNWQRYTAGSGRSALKFEEGVDAYVPFIGSVNDVLDVTVAKLKSTMCNNGALTLREFHNNAVLTRVSKQSLIEGGTSNVLSHDQIVSN